MPIGYQVEQGGRFLRISAAGVLSFAEILETKDRLMFDPAAREVRRVLVDLLAVEQFALEPASLRALATTHTSLPFAAAGSRMAFVVASPLAYGLARMYELSRWNAPDAIDVFRDAEAAQRWLDE